MAKELTTAVLVTDQAELTRPPSISDVPAQRASRGFTIAATAATAVIAAGCVIASAMVDHALVQGALLLAGVLVLFLGLATVMPRFAVLRWNRAYARLCQQAQCTPGTVVDLELRAHGRGDVSTITGGSVLYTAADGQQRLVLIRIAPQLMWRLPEHQLPTQSSPAVVWHSPDGAIAQARVLVGDVQPTASEQA